MIKMALIDHTGTITDEDLIQGAAALNIQGVDVAKPVGEDGWGIEVTMRAVTSGKASDVADDEQTVAMFSSPDQPDALGYHDVAPNGQPFAHVFPTLDPTKPWETIAGHETWEQAVDQLCNMILSSANGKLLAAEVADPVEDDSFEIEVPAASGSGTVKVPATNIVTPWWFGPGIMPENMTGRFDKMSKLGGPITTTPGGYWQWFDPKHGWQQVVDNRKPKSRYRQALDALGIGRAHRRKISADITRRILLPDATNPAGALVVIEGLEMVNAIISMLEEVTRGKISPASARERLREFVASIASEVT